MYPAGAVGLGWGALRGQIRMWNSDEIRNCAGFGARRMYRRPPRSANSDCRCCSPNGVAAHLALRWMVASTAVLRRRTKLSLHAPCIRETRKCDRSRAAHTPLCRGQLQKRAPMGSHGAPPGPRSCGGMRRAFRTVRNGPLDMVMNEPWRVLGSRPCRSHADGLARLTCSGVEHRRQRRWGCAVLTGTCPYIDIQR